MATIEVECRYCQSKHVQRNGKSENGEQRYRCKTCGKSFQMDYRYIANRPGVPEKIIEMAMNGSGVRDTGRVLGISPTTVAAHLKNSSHRQ